VSERLDAESSAEAAIIASPDRSVDGLTRS